MWESEFLVCLVSGKKFVSESLVINLENLERGGGVDYILEDEYEDMREYYLKKRLSILLLLEGLLWIN